MFLSLELIKGPGTHPIGQRRVGDALLGQGGGTDAKKISFAKRHTFGHEWQDGNKKNPRLPSGIDLKNPSFQVGAASAAPFSVVLVLQMFPNNAQPRATLVYTQNLLLKSTFEMLKEGASHFVMKLLDILRKKRPLVGLVSQPEGKVLFTRRDPSPTEQVEEFNLLDEGTV